MCMAASACGWPPAVMSLIHAVRLNEIEPYTCLCGVLERLPTLLPAMLRTFCAILAVGSSTAVAVSFVTQCPIRMLSATFLSCTPNLSTRVALA